MDSKTRPGGDKTLGQILVDKGIIGREQLDRALQIKAEQPGKYLGEILFEMGVSQDKINRALYYSNKRKTIGEILVDQKLITPDQLEEALSKQKKIKEKWGHTRPLGLLLIELGYINSRGYLTALSKHFNMPILSMKDYQPNPQLQKVIGERYAMERKIIVLENSAKTIKLVLADPSAQVIEELQKAVPPGKSIEFYLASYGEIDESLRRVADPFSFTQYR
ncbi:MAG TPA: hypothetical protein PLQ15_12230 [Syntrophales bacterium]|nr:hypothetical protein [Syntrophobacterales bacterium]HQL91355.1 hypothetical protein [Syntrophales bacterium]